MAKVTFPRLLWTAVSGASSTFKLGGRGTKEAALEARRMKEREDRAAPSAGGTAYLTPPYIDKAECEAWNAADLFYMKHAGRMRTWLRHWRVTDGTSTYDRWMKYAVPLLLRGYPVPAMELAYFYTPVTVPPYPEPTALYKYQPGDICLPPAKCETYGINFISVHFAMRTNPTRPADPPLYCIQAYAEYNNGHRHSPHRWWPSWAYSFNKPPLPPIWVYPGEPLNGPLHQYLHFNQIPTAYALQGWSCQRDPAGYTRPDYWPDPATHFQSQWLANGQSWAHWPRNRMTGGRGPAGGIDPTLSWPTPTATAVYYPLWY